MYPNYHTVSDGSFFIYLSRLSINSVSAGLSGDSFMFYVMLFLESGCVGEYMPCVAGTATVWQLPAACGVQNCYLVLKFAILSINMDYLVDDVLVGSVEISQYHRQVIYRNVGRPPR